MRRVWLAFLGVCAFASLAGLAQSQQPDVSGSWEMVIETRHGEMTSTVKFFQEGDKLKVTMTQPRGGDTAGEGSINGNVIQWSIIRNTARGELTVVYKGTVQGATMSGQADIEGGDSAPWRAVRR